MKTLAVHVETMEPRMMMAGDVSVRVAGGDLRITGDNADNAVQMYQVAIPDLGIGIRIEGLDGTKINGQDFYQIDFGDAVSDDIRINLRGGDNRFAMLNGDDAPAGSPAWHIADDLVINSGRGDDVLIVQAASADDVTIRSGGGEDAVRFEFGDIADRLSVNTGSGNDLVSSSGSGEIARTSINLGSGKDAMLAANMRPDGDVRVSMGSGDDMMFVINSDFNRGLDVNGGGGSDAIVDTVSTAPLDYGSGLQQRSVESYRRVSGQDFLGERFEAKKQTGADEAEFDFMIEIGLI